MYDSETDRLVLEELRNLRTLVRRLGIYFVILSLLPMISTILWLVFIGATVGGLFGGAAKSLSSTSERSSTPSTSFTQSFNRLEKSMDQLVKSVPAWEPTKQQQPSRPKESTRIYRNGQPYVLDPTAPNGMRPAR